ncbi:MAG: UDP-N-acetylmuramoyl-L-alanine--D-glutamate ligase [Candidatus Omnitrophica bacterium]|nr:UDP-N-acetylmuramoyl-L-alanine--D-glutamate ligase [Candidatus Omnitrophota bacterium]
MKNTENYRNKKVIIVGLARSGVASANLLYGLGAKVSITDNQDNDAVRANAARLKSNDIRLELGAHTREFVKGNDLMIISPGVKNDAQPVIWAQELQIPVISEIEFAADLCPGKIIAVTGSNGKTTVTTLIGKVIEAGMHHAFVCGNIGTPFSSLVDKMSDNDFVSLEVSSFQLEKISKFKPYIAVILNITKNHLDRHKDMQEYLDAKKRIYMNQDDSDFLVLNSEDPILKDLAKEAKSKPVFFARSAGLNPNEAAVLAVGSILGASRDKILKVFKDFQGLEHRMEFVAEIKKVRFVNDSKATTADSAKWALENLGCPVFLIAGGKDKGVDYGLIKEAARKKVKELILIGEAAGNIARALAGELKTEAAATLDEAVRKAFSRASAGDCVLLSPMCSSFDMFTNYEERGKAFKDSVLKLAEENKYGP